MEQNIERTINDLADHIQRIIKSGSGEERELLPELVSSLTRLTDVYNTHYFNLVDC